MHSHAHENRNTSRAPRGLARRLLTVAAMVCALIPAQVHAGASDMRVDMSIVIFKRLLAADSDLPKRLDPAGHLPIVLFHAGNERRAAEIARQFAGADVRGIAIATEATSDPLLNRWASRLPAAIFIAEPCSRTTLAAVVQYGIDHHVIVYSPFEGDVERGVLGGISIEAQVRPLLNQATLDASRVALKPLFIQASKVVQ